MHLVRRTRWRLSPLAATVLALTAGVAFPIAGASSAAETRAASCKTVNLTVSISWDTTSNPTASAVLTKIRYPKGVALPGSGIGEQVRARVSNLTGVNDGLFDASDNDAGQAGPDPQVHVGLVGKSMIRPGEFASVEFDCQPGAATPTATSFDCESEVATGTGTVASTCKLSLRVDGARAKAPPPDLSRKEENP